MGSKAKNSPAPRPLPRWAWGDGVVIALVLLGFVAFPRLFTPGGAVRAARVLSATGEVSYPLPAKESRTVEAAGPLGVTLVALTPAGARVVDSPCPSKLCIRMGEATRPGQSLVCAPNRVAVVMEGGAAPGEEGVDAILH